MKHKTSLILKIILCNNIKTFHLDNILFNLSFQNSNFKGLHSCRWLSRKFWNKSQWTGGFLSPIPLQQSWTPLSRWSWRQKSLGLKFSALTMLKSHKCWMIKLIFLRTQELMVFQFLTSIKYHLAKMLFNSADKVNTSNFMTTLLEHCLFAFLDVFSGRHFFLKPLNPYSEDRVCFERIPEVEAELNSFLERYKTKISSSSPYFVSHFVQVRKYNLM